MEYVQDDATEHADILTSQVPMLLSARPQSATEDERVPARPQRDQYILHHSVDARAESRCQATILKRTVEELQAKKSLDSL